MKKPIDDAVSSSRDVKVTDAVKIEPVLAEAETSVAFFAPASG